MVVVDFECPWNFQKFRVCGRTSLSDAAKRKAAYAVRGRRKAEGDERAGQNQIIRHQSIKFLET
jgi:hypothetical protein